MFLEVTKSELNVIQVALDHLYDMQSDVLAEALLDKDKVMAADAYCITKMCGEIQAEIEDLLTNK